MYTCLSINQPIQHTVISCKIKTNKNNQNTIIKDRSKAIQVESSIVCNRKSKKKAVVVHSCLCVYTLP